MADNPTTVGFVAAGVAAAVGASAVGGLSTGSSGAIGLVVVGACLAATQFSKVEAPVEEKKPKLSKAQKKAAKKAREEATSKNRAARAQEREIARATEPEEEEEEPVVEEPKLSKSALRRQKKAQREKDEKAAAAAAAKAAKAESKGKKKKKKKEKEPEPEPEPEPTKKKKNKKKKKKVVESEDDEPLISEPVDDGWEVVKTNPSSKDRKVKAAAAAALEGDEGEIKSGPAYTMEVDIPSKFYGKIIGPSGATRQALSDATGCDISVPKRDSINGTIVLTGDQAACEVCENAIQELVTRGYCSLLDKDTTDDGVIVPARLHGVVIGPRGSNIKAIQEKTGCRINMPDKESSSDKITVVGPPSGVLAAIEAINQLVADGFSSLTHENYTKDTVSVAGNQIATLIGTGGSTIKELQARTGAKINIPKGASGAIVVVGLVGEPQQIATLRTEILALLKPPEPLPIREEWSQDATARMLNLW